MTNYFQSFLLLLFLSSCLFNDVYGGSCKIVLIKINKNNQNNESLSKYVVLLKNITPFGNFNAVTLSNALEKLIPSISVDTFVSNWMI